MPRVVSKSRASFSPTAQLSLFCHSCVLDRRSHFDIFPTSNQPVPTVNHLQNSPRPGRNQTRSRNQTSRQLILERHYGQNRRLSIHESYRILKRRSAMVFATGRNADDLRRRARTFARIQTCLAPTYRHSHCFIRDNSNQTAHTTVATYG